MMLELIFHSAASGIEFLFKGGVFIVPILLCSVIAVALIIERFWYYHTARCPVQSFFPRLAAAVKQHDMDDALALCEQQKGVLPRLFALVLTQRHRSIEELEKLVSIAGSREIQTLSRHVRGLGIIGHITPLMGLLGTVVGMVKTFMQIAHLSGHVNPSLLAGGIWEALLTTAAGLTVAIPVIMTHHYFEGVVEHFTFQMKNYSLELIELLKHD